MRNSLIVAALLICQVSFSQNQTKATGVPYSAGVPVWIPLEKSASEVAIDTATGYVYQWHRSPGASNVGAWIRVGQGIDTLGSAAAPAYTPLRNRSYFVVNTDNELYRYSGSGTTWNCMNCGLSATVTTDATLSGDGSGGTPLKIAQQSATTSEMLTWTGATWEPSWGNPYTFVTSGATITTAVNEILIGTTSADITIGLPACSATTDQKHFKFIRNGTDPFSVTIDPNGSQTFYDMTIVKVVYGKISIDCTCQFSAGTGVWFYDNN